MVILNIVRRYGASSNDPILKSETTVRLQDLATKINNNDHIAFTSYMPVLIGMSEKYYFKNKILKIILYKGSDHLRKTPQILS